MIQLTTPSHGPTPPHNPRYHCNLVTVTDLPFKIILQWLQCSLVFPCCAVFMLALVSVSVSSDACCQVPCPGSGPSLLTMYSTAHSLRRVGVTVPPSSSPLLPFPPPLCLAQSSVWLDTSHLHIYRAKPPPLAFTAPLLPLHLFLAADNLIFTPAAFLCLPFPIPPSPHYLFMFFVDFMVFSRVSYSISLSVQFIVLLAKRVGGTASMLLLTGVPRLHCCETFWEHQSFQHLQPGR
jgi:hypothetical protein